MKTQEIRSWTGQLLFTCEVEDDDPNPMRTAVTGANLTGANLTGANLTGADLTDADLTGANLTGARLTDADLTGADLTDADLADADLTDADLTDAREDFRSVLDLAPHEVGGLLLALREGRIDGTHYEGSCACLVGTIGNLRGCKYDAVPGIPPDSLRPSERLFLAISPGHLPSINPVAKIVEGWILEWQSEHPEYAQAMR